MMLSPGEKDFSQFWANLRHLNDLESYIFGHKPEMSDQLIFRVTLKEDIYFS